MWSTVLLSCLVHTNLGVLSDSTESLSRSLTPAPRFPWGRCSISFGSCICQPSPAAMPSWGLCDGLCSPGLVLTSPDLPRSSLPNCYQVKRCWDSEISLGKQYGQNSDLFI